MFSVLRYSNKRLLLSQTSRHRTQKDNNSQHLTHQQRQTFLNFFNESSNSKNSNTDKKKEADIYHQNFFQRLAQPFKESLFDGPQIEYQKEKRLALKEAKEREELAQKYFNLGQYQKALENFKGTLLLLRKYYAETHPKVAYYYNKIADVYFEVKEWDQAINHYEEALEILENNFGGQDGEVGRCHFLLGMCYAKQKKHAFAIENLKRSLEIYEVSPKENQQTIASCYSMLAECYLQYGRYKEVLEYTQKLITLLREMYKDEKLEEEKDPLMTQYYLNLGISLAHATGEYELASQYLDKYMRNQVSIKGSGVGNYYLGKGQIKAMQGLNGEALEFYKKAIETASKSAGSQSKLLGPCYNAIGLVHLESAKYEEALLSFKKGLEYFGEETCLEAAVCHRNIAVTYYHKGDYSKAIASFIKSAEGRAQVFEGLKEGELELGVLHACISGLSYKKGDYKTARSYYEKFLETTMMLYSKETTDFLRRRKSAN